MHAWVNCKCVVLCSRVECKDVCDTFLHTQPHPPPHPPTHPSTPPHAKAPTFGVHLATSLDFDFFQSVSSERERAGQEHILALSKAC